MVRRFNTVLLVLVLVASVLATANLARAVVGGLRGDDVVAAQVRHLDAVAENAAPRMQALFPEGAFFTWTLTGLAAGNLAKRGVDVDVHRRVVDRAVAATGTSEMAEHFGRTKGLEHGAFYRGWRLLLLVDQATLSGDAAQRDAVAREAAEVLAAIDASPTGLVESYPGRAWPCDLVVAMAAIARADDLVALDGYEAARDRWLKRMEAHRDPDTGLLVHEAGSAAPRGSSQSIITLFLADVDKAHGEREWAGFRREFLSARAGLVGFREHPHGVRKGGDVDSGPLILGVSASASAVALGGARVHGDTGLAAELDREAEFLGLPWLWPRTYALGLLPVGDAFVAYARSVPVGNNSQSLPEAPAPWWPMWFVLTALPGALAGWALVRRRARA